MSRLTSGSGFIFQFHIHMILLNVVRRESTNFEKLWHQSTHFLLSSCGIKRLSNKISTGTNLSQLTASWPIQRTCSHKLSLSSSSNMSLKKPVFTFGSFCEHFLWFARPWLHGSNSEKGRWIERNKKRWTVGGRCEQQWIIWKPHAGAFRSNMLSKAAARFSQQAGSGPKKNKTSENSNIWS